MTGPELEELTRSAWRAGCHAALAEGRVNKVSQHREVFRATPAEVRELLARAAGCHLLEFTTTFPRIWPLPPIFGR